MPVLLVNILNGAIYALLILVIAYVVMLNLGAATGSFSMTSPVGRLLRQIVEPMLAPFRRILPPSRTGGWDFSPVFVMLILSLIRGLLQNQIR